VSETGQGSKKQQATRRTSEQSHTTYMRRRGVWRMGRLHTSASFWETVA
jgi:hypothetical protein